MTTVHVPLQHPHWQERGCSVHTWPDWGHACGIPEPWHSPASRSRRYPADCRWRQVSSGHLSQPAPLPQRTAPLPYSRPPCKVAPLAGPVPYMCRTWSATHENFEKFSTSSLVISPSVTSRPPPPPPHPHIKWWIRLPIPLHAPTLCIGYIKWISSSLCWSISVSFFSVCLSVPLSLSTMFSFSVNDHLGGTRTASVDNKNKTNTHTHAP